MKFYGLFIGIDRYASTSINWLNCAKRDAVALHSLFSDNFQGESKLLIDETATHASIKEEFERLAKCEPDDFVVVSFSGHGTETQEIVPYDADRSNLSETCIPLSVLSDWFSKIPSKRMVCILDCCFSGAMGAKALQVDIAARKIDSAEEMLKQLSGEGRLILTASRATEPAWENQKFGHGLLTYHLITALQGAEEVRKDEKVGIYRLLEYVTERVVNDAKDIGKIQNPTLLGQFNSSLTWPIFIPGELYKTAFPDRIKKIISPDIKSLSEYGFPQQLVDSWAGSISSLNQLQLDAINEFGLLDGNHLIVSAPTSSGKTMIGELAAISGTLERKRAIFLFPLKALVNDKLKHFNEIYKTFGVRTIKATGESTSDDIIPLMRGQYDICLMTYEKFSALVLGSPHILEQVSTVVIDEVQMIADDSRGVNLEFVLTLLKMKQHVGIEPQIIALSAVIGDTNGLERWLNARLLRRTERPVPLDEGIIRANGSVRYIESDTGEEKEIPSYTQPEFRKGSSQDIIIPLARKLVNEDKSIIVFRATRGEARSTALYLAGALNLAPVQVALDLLPNNDPSLASGRLRDALGGGVAFHISDLDSEERSLIEEQFRARPTALKVIAATTTLAMGVNTPAEAVIIAGLNHPGDKPYSVAEYKNIIGRAGRLGFSERGHSYLVALDGMEENYFWNNYVLGKPEDLHSKFLSENTDPRSLIARALTAVSGMTGRGLSAKEIIEFLESSFGVFQQKNKNESWGWDENEIARALDSLLSHKLIELGENQLYQLTPLGKLAGESGLEIESIIRLVGALEGISAESLSDPSLIALAQITCELDKVLFPMNKKSTLKEPQTWMSEVRNQGIPHQIISAMQRAVKDTTQVTLRTKKTVACLLWITNMPLSEMEDILTKFGGKFDGAAGPLRSVISRSCDVLSVVARVAELLNPALDLGERVSRLQIRLECGMSSQMLELGAKIGNILNRGDYLALLKEEILTAEKFLDTDNEGIILECLNGNRQKLAQAKEALVRIDSEIGLDLIFPIVPKYES